MTKAEVDAMANSEYHQWRAYIVWKSEQMKLARATGG